MDSAVVPHILAKGKVAKDGRPYVHMVTVNSVSRGEAVTIWPSVIVYKGRLLKVGVPESPSHSLFVVIVTGLSKQQA